MFKPNVLYIFCFATVITLAFYYLASVKAILSATLAFLPDKPEIGIHLITNYPVMTEKPWSKNQTEGDTTKLWQRQEEVEETLQRNLNNPLVAAVHLLINQQLAEQRLNQLNFHNKHKLVVHYIKALPRYRDFFKYASDRLRNEVVIVMNMDIYLGEGFDELNKTFLVNQNVAYALTRHGRQEKRCNMGKNAGYCETGYIGSHDAFIFVLNRRLEESVLSEFDYEMHVYGGENVLLWVLRNRMQKKLFNPCKYLKIYHNHCVNIHSSVRTRINKKGKSAWVPPSGLYE